MKEQRTTTGFEIAVIGMSGRFPGAKTIDEFWENLKNGVEALSFSTYQELKEAGIDTHRVENPNFVKAKGGMLEDREFFDAPFFGYSATEAEIMDPQFRLFHQCLWNALENAGYNPHCYEGSIGLYAGSSLNLDWHARCMLSGKSEELGEFNASLLTNKDFLSATVSYKLNLKGPSVVVQSACSTSLVAIHMGCRALLMRECDIALAGGVSVTSDESYGYVYQEGMILSPDGHCRAFEAKAKGTAAGDGVGAVVLKRLKAALEDGDTIHAVILGSTLNNDGLRKVGFTAPSVEGQTAVIKAALHMAKVEPESITYVETHGTATPLGDPIEIEALKLALDTDKKGFCKIGSVKTNFGHLDVAAGVAAFIKTVLALKHRRIPPSLHFQVPNPKIDFENSPFQVNARLSPWENEKYPLRAGVSSFGIGGTNAHIVLEEAPQITSSSKSRSWHILPLSAKTPSALERLTLNLADHLKRNPGINLADVSYTLHVGRNAFEHRNMVVCADVPGAIEALQSPVSGNLRASSPKAAEESTVVFMFPGLGAQYVNMGLDIYRTEPFFREEMDRCFKILTPIIGFDLKEVLYPGDGMEEAGDKINRIEISQLVVFIFEYALAKLLIKWGIKPHAMIGYSFGEYTAALIAGIFSPEEALELVASRGQLIRKAGTGLMLSVPLPVAELNPLLNSQLTIAIDNGPSCVVSGETADVEAFEKKVKTKGYLCMRLQGSHAIHSKMMEPILQEFAERAGQITLNKPKIPYISNVTGKWVLGDQVVTPGYWAKQLRETVRFSDGIKELIKDPNTIFIEIGPGRDLSTLILRYINDNAHQHVVNLVRQSQKKAADEYYLLRKIGQCWLYGVNIDWFAFYSGEKRHRIPLPPYPFDSRRYWIDYDLYSVSKEVLTGHTQPGKRPDMEDWFFLPFWTRSLSIPVGTSDIHEKDGWLVFIDDYGIGSAFVRRLKQKGKTVVTISPGKQLSKSQEGGYSINPRQAANYRDLFSELDRSSLELSNIAHFWGISQTGGRSPQLARETVDRGQSLGFYSLLYLGKAIGKRKKQGSVEIIVITSDMQEVTGQETLCPEKSTVLGPLKVIPQEQPNITCRSIDLVLPEPGHWQERKMIDQLEAELLTKTLDREVAFRGNNRWVRTYEPIKPKEPQKEALPLKEEGVYLVTGGLGNIGLILAEYLVKSVKAKVILTGRSTFPAREEWKNYLSSNGGQALVAAKIAKLQEFEKMGGKVLTFAADTADQQRMQEVIRQAEEIFGPLNGVIHGAGIINGKSIDVVRKIGEAECEEQFRPKIYGLLTLANLLQDKDLDFYYQLSSISSVLGGLRFAAYSAANIFMDAFVSLHNQQNLRHWTSILWEGMSPAESVMAFERIFSLGQIDHVVVSCSEPLKDRLDKWINLETLQERENESQQQDSANLLPRPNLMNPYREPQNPLQKKVVDIWQKMFGFERIGIDDDFFELGGDSLKAITVIAKIHKALNVEIPLLEFFDRPTVSRLTRYIENAETSAYSPITPVEKKEYYALSSAQKRLYILQQMDLKSTSYNHAKLMPLEMEVDRGKFENALKQLIRRHQSLRTSIEVIENEPVQRIHHEVEFEVRYYEMNEDEAKELGKNFVKSFDLSQAPFLRVALIKLEEKKYILMFDMHHIITDARSYQLFLDEFLILYEGKVLPGLTLQYKDYSEWQNREKDQGALKEQEKYWLKTLEGELPVLNLPCDFVRPPIQSFEGDSFDFIMGKEIVRPMRELSKSHDVTIYMTLLALYTVLMSKLSGQEDILVGTPVVGRRHDDLDSILGIFTNTLVMRNFPSREKNFADFLQEVKERTLKAFENQGYQFEDLVEKLLIKRNKSRNPLFDVMFNMQNPAENPGDEEPAAVENNPYEFENKIAKFDTQLFCKEVGDTLIFTMEYCSKIFKKETAEKFVKYFHEITAAVIENAEIKLEDIAVSHGLFDQQLSIPETDFAF